MPLVSNYKKYELGRRMAAAEQLLSEFDNNVKINAVSQLQAQKTAIQNDASGLSLTATEQTEYDTIIGNIDSKITAYNN